MAEMVSALLNGKWWLTIPKHRADRPQWYTPEGWERKRLDVMELAIHPGDTVVDVGAEEGDMSALCAMFAGPDGRIVLVEPNPKVWPNIRAIFQHPDNRTKLAPVWNWFVGFAAATTELHPHLDDIGALAKPRIDHPDDDPWPECAFGPIIGDHGFRVLAQQYDSTPRIKLDDLIEAADVVTMDVEGAEYDVLWGMRRIMQESKPVVFVSIHPPPLADWYHRKPSEIHDLMAKVGYRGYWLWEDHEQHWMFTHPEGRQVYF